MGTAKRLERAFTQAPVLPLGRRSKYVLISDCHRGVGTSSDNFLKNQHLYFAALEHYYRLGYTYIELGDGDELWENRRLRNIIEVHSDVYDMLTRFHISGRLYMLYGNHDIVKKRLQHPSGSMSIRDGYHYRNKKTSFARLRDLPPANSDKRRNFLYHKKAHRIIYALRLIYALFDSVTFLRVLSLTRFPTGRCAFFKIGLRGL